MDNIKLKNCILENLHQIENKTYLGYWRMYFNHGWGGRWFTNDGQTAVEGRCAENLSDEQTKNLNALINKLCNLFPQGCNWQMVNWLDNYTSVADNVYLFDAEIDSDYFIVKFDTTYGNGDYPVRIYVHTNN